MRQRDVFTLVRDALCMIVALIGSTYEAFLRSEEPRLELLGFYALLLGFGTAVPAAISLFSSTSQGPPAEPSPNGRAGAVDLRHPDRARRRDGDDGTTRRRSRSRR